MVGEGESRKEVTVVSTTLKPGDEVLVYVGEIVPRDGLICEGKAFVDESIHPPLCSLLIIIGARQK
ncbi:MAG: hypothetical protein WA364_13650 [Candidatus Nitrosopolaris sp.]